jgi:orotidine-5'-phosphate decarboxylase
MQSIDQWLKLWKKRYPIGLVAGATHLKDLRKIRKYAGAMPLLVPGVGPQGGALGNVVENGFGGKFGALMINLSREPLYASSDRKFAEAAGDKMRENRFMVTQQLSAIKRKQN